MKLFDLIKSHVKAYTRRSKTGKVVSVGAHEDSRSKKALDKKSPAHQFVSGKEVMFRPPAGQGIRIRPGMVQKIDEKKKELTVLGRRNREGEQVIYTVPFRDAMTIANYERAKAKQNKRRTDPEKYVSDGDRANAHFNLSSEEWRKRGELVEQRLGFSESKIVSHPGFRGVAFKICSDLAKENGISTRLSSNTGDILWNRAMDPDYQEMLLNYAVAAIKSYRTELAKPLDKQTKENIAGFKAWVEGKQSKSYVSTTMAIEGKRAAIRYLQERRKRLKELSSLDISAMEEDPEARQMLQNVASQPKQLLYTMHKRGETLPNTVKAMLGRLSQVEADAVRLKLGIPPFLPVERKDGMPNEKVAGLLNHMGQLDGGKLRWTRNTVGSLLTEAYAKMKKMPEFKDLVYFVDRNLGREDVNFYRPANTHSGATTEEDYYRELAAEREQRRTPKGGEAMAKSGANDGAEEDLKSGPIDQSIAEDVAGKNFGAPTQTICVDFDGVIADYSHGYQGEDVFGAIIPGAAASLQRLTELGWRIIIFSTRPNTQALRDYLLEHSIPYTAINENPEQPEGANPGKPIADWYLDDRALRFTDWDGAMLRLVPEDPATEPQQSDERPKLTKSQVWITAPLDRIPADLHPAGHFEAAGYSYEVEHRNGTAVLAKAEKDGEPVTGGFDELLGAATHAALVKALDERYPKSQVATTRHGVCIVFPGEELAKSFSGDMAKDYPGGRWVTIKEGPLAGRHIYLLPHKDGSATVLVGGGPALRHKVIQPKQDDKKDAEETTEAEKKTEKKEFESHPKLSEAEEKEVKAKKNEVSEQIKEERQAMAKAVASVAYLFKSYTDAQKAKIAKVMREFKAGTLKSSDGTVVTDRKQAIAIALSEAGASEGGKNAAA